VIIVLLVRTKPSINLGKNLSILCHLTGSSVNFSKLAESVNQSHSQLNQLNPVQKSDVLKVCKESGLHAGEFAFCFPQILGQTGELFGEDSFVLTSTCLSVGLNTTRPWFTTCSSNSSFTLLAIKAVELTK